jgi:hypothetical protein
VPRSTYYHRPRPESAENLRLLRRLDELYLDCPFFGSRRMAVTLEVNRKRIQRLMRILGIEALYPKPNLSRPAPGHEIYPYLLRGVSIEPQVARPLLPSIRETHVVSPLHTPLSFLKKHPNQPAVHGRRLRLPQEICPVSLRRLRRSRGSLTAGQKSAEGIVGHVVGKVSEALRNRKVETTDRPSRER